MPIGTSDGEQFPTEFDLAASKLPAADRETMDTWEEIKARQGRSDDEIRKQTPDNQEIFSIPDLPDHYMLRKTKDVDSKDLISENIAEAGATLSTLFLVPQTKRGSYALHEPAMRYGNSGAYHVIHAETGTYAGNVTLSYDKVKRDIHVEYASSDTIGRRGTGLDKMQQYQGGIRGEGISQKALMANRNTMAIGPAELSSLGPELKRIFPEAQTVSGFRISGARDLAKTSRNVTRPLPEPLPTPSGRIAPASSVVPLGAARQISGGGGGGAGLPPSARWGILPLQ